ncbi:MAG: aspartate kinase [Tindallia sp. MSAO_Bac2]|nr:MAG: aspartate kinase [Tindallia sp. MSAO_Bac2]
MNIIVQKFGGTSLATSENQMDAINKIVSAAKNGYMPVVVVSAMGRNGSPYATDTLKSLLSIDGTMPDSRHMDLLLSCGEVISAVILSDKLKKAGYESEALTGWQAGIVTNDHFGCAEILSIEKEVLKSYLEKDIIPVVSGFQGITMDREITTLGRGGSDTTAAALGAALNADCVEIYTDVDGIMTADPRVVDDACILEEMHYDEVFQMADQGAKVIHPRAVEIARQNNLSVRIKNTRSDHPGTLICSQRQHFDLRYSSHGPEHLLTAVTQKNDIAQVIISRMETGLQEESRLFEDMANCGISIDMINFSPERKIFTIEEGKTIELKNLLENYPVQFNVTPQLSKVTVIGNRMTGIPGVMATVFSALAEEGIRILQSSDSHATISCLVRQNEAPRAVQSLHRFFKLHRRK